MQEIEPVLKHYTHIKDVSQGMCGLDCTGPQCLHTSKVRLWKTLLLVTVKTREFLIHVFVCGVWCVWVYVHGCGYMCIHVHADVGKRGSGEQRRE